MNPSAEFNATTGFTESVDSGKTTLVLAHNWVQAHLWILYPAGDTNASNRQAGVAGHAFRPVGSFSGAP